MKLETNIQIILSLVLLRANGHTEILNILVMARAAKAGRNAAEVDKIQNKNLPNRKYKNKIQKMQLQDM